MLSPYFTHYLVFGEWFPHTLSIPMFHHYISCEERAVLSQVDDNARYLIEELLNISIA
jgi:hypothetical protein